MARITFLLPIPSVSPQSSLLASPGISSDQYFGRGSYDPSASAEAKSRLQQFSGASAISSNQYFGRDDDPDAGQGGNEDGEGDGLEGVERAAREMIGKVLANPDVQQLGEGIRAGALKVSLFKLIARSIETITDVYVLVLVASILIAAFRLSGQNVCRGSIDAFSTCFGFYYTLLRHSGCSPVGSLTSDLHRLLRLFS